MNQMKPLLFNAEMRKAFVAGLKTQTRRPVKPKFRDGEIGWQILRDAHTDEFRYAEYFDEYENETRMLLPPYQVGDVLYIPEPWRFSKCLGTLRREVEFQDGTHVKFNFETLERAEKWHKYLDKPVHQWQSPYFMPREAARYFARVTALDIQKLQAITDAQILAEGVPGDLDYPINAIFCPACHGTGHAIGVGGNGGAVEVDCCHCDTLRKRFSNLWDRTVPPKVKEVFGYDANPDVWAISLEKIPRSEAYRFKVEAHPRFSITGGV